ncbi:MAG: hypothetical protein AAF296_04955 [Pseudomonadota bacterium]
MLGLRMLRTLKDNGGQVAVIFAMTIMPMLTLLVMSIDFQRTTSTKSQILHELDSAVLRGARYIQLGQSPEDVRALLIEQVEARVNSNPNLFCKPLNIQFANRNRELTASIECSVDTVIGPPAGPENIMFKEAAQSEWDVGLLDVAFMFDISGSMDSNNRINALKNAANDALNVLLPEGNESLNEGVRIAMVAYDDMINAGEFFEDVTGLAETRWYHATDYYRDWKKVGEEPYMKNVCKWVIPRTCSKYNESGKCTKWTGGKKECTPTPAVRDIREPYGPQKTRTIKRKIVSTCVWERPGDYVFTDFGPTMKAGTQPRITVPKSNLYDTDEIIYNASEIEGNPHGFMSAAYAHFWRDRPDHKDGWRRAGENCSGIEPLALTRDRQKLTKYIQGLKTRNGTAGHQGIAWSWYLISDKWAHIFDGDSEPNRYDEPQGNKALILMTDGDFVNQRFKNEHGNSDTQARALCDQIKAQSRVEIYTVAFQAPSKGQKVLEYCASNPSFAFTADNEAELREAYNKIAGSLSELRLTQ